MSSTDEGYRKLEYFSENVAADKKENIELDMANFLEYIVLKCRMRYNKYKICGYMNQG